MNVCASCGASIPAGAASCPQCGAATATAAKPPGPLRRVLTGVVGFPLIGLGTFLGLGLGLCLDHPTKGGWECQQWGWPFLFLGIPSLAIGIPFALATLVPFGTFRRILVGIGAAVPMAVLTAMAVSAAAAAFGATGDDFFLYFVMWAAAAAVACSLAFYLGYRIAR